jgi:GDP-L-fucose synthase
MKKILICGGTGFIGRNLVEHYSKNSNYKVTATHFRRSPVPIPNVDWIEVDLRKDQDVKRALEDIDIVLQFAATTSGSKDIINQPYLHVTDNAVMNSIILRECYEKNIEHFVFPSCTVMYQSSDVGLLETDFDESKEILPFYFGVGNTKVYIEKMCKFYSRFNRTKHTVIRHSNIYGPHDKFDLEKSHVFGASITKVMKPKDGKITVWGTGQESRDLLYISDLINFIDLSLEKQDSFYELYNVGYGQSIKIIDLIHKIIQISGVDIKVEHDLSKPTVPTSLFLNCQKAKNDLGWEPNINVENGISLTLDWYKKNILETF